MEVEEEEAEGLGTGNHLEKVRRVIRKGTTMRLNWSFWDNSEDILDEFGTLEEVGGGS